jgi:hypothetical protein
MKKKIIQGQELSNLKKKMADEIAGEDSIELRNKALCIDCKEPAIPKCHTEAGIKEYAISGLCEECFDKIFVDPNESRVSMKAWYLFGRGGRMNTFGEFVSGLFGLMFCVVFYAMFITMVLIIPFLLFSPS